MDPLQPGDYCRDPEHHVYQVLRVANHRVYLKDILTDTRLLCAEARVDRLTPRETVQALMQAWLTGPI